MTGTVKRSLATLVLLACVTVVTSAAFVAVSYLKWNWLSVALGSAVAVLLVVCLGLLIDALENWLDRNEAGADEVEREP